MKYVIQGNVRQESARSGICHFGNCRREEVRFENVHQETVLKPRTPTQTNNTDAVSKVRILMKQVINYLKTFSQ